MRDPVFPSGAHGVFMIDVVSGGVADKAGVKLGDRLVEINSENVEHLVHDQIVQKVGEMIFSC